MFRPNRILCVLTCLLLAAFAVNAQENESHLIHVGINPFGVIYGSYKLDAGVPIGGLLEIGAQVNHFRGEQFANLIGSDPTSVATRTTAGFTVRIFPAKTASGFFIGGRLMYLNVDPADPLASTINDATAGIDLGWRWAWPIGQNFGMFFQTYLGVQRWIFSADIPPILGTLQLPIWPSAGLHFGIFL